MSHRSTTRVVFLLALAWCTGAHAADRNWWPVVVEKDAVPGPRTSWTALGPLAFYGPLGDGRTASGVRPFYTQRFGADGQPEGGTLLYPLARWEHDPAGYRWTIFNLVNRGRTRASDDHADLQLFDIWPFYFSRQTGDPASSYRAVFPLYGDVSNRFGQDRWRWVLFPLYGRFEKNGVTTTTAPWPFVKVLQGDGNRGIEVWPIAGHREKPGVYRADFALWPLLYRTVSNPDAPEPNVQAGFLPFYAVDRRPGYVSETFGWPFWGYVDRTEPYRYHAQHYFWPFWVQGRGDERYVNRWAPFYTRSIMRGTDKRWVMWPIWREESWKDAQRTHERRQLVYFLYHSTVQRSHLNPSAAPASKTHVWPLLSAWDNGAGRKQVQVLSPLEVFFPQNEHVRLSWSPFFALYRYHQHAPGETRHSLLWDGVSYRRSDDAGTREFHLGPLLGVESTPHFRRVSLFNGLVGFQRSSHRGWRPFFRGGGSTTVKSDAASSP
jgi:hypothetical protein